MNSSYTVFLCLFLSCIATRTVYEILKKAGKLNPKSKTLFTFIFAAMCILWISWFSLCPRDPLRISIPGSIRFAGLGLFIAGWGLALGGLIQLKGVENIDHLVTTGLYAKVRHPMYLGFILWIIGWAIFFGAAMSLIAGFIGIANIIYWRNLEEVHLEREFGDIYRKYRGQTWF